MVNNYENITVSPPREFRNQPLSGVKQKVERYEDLLIKPPIGYRNKPKRPQRQPPAVPTDKAPLEPTTNPFNFDDEFIPNR